MIVREPFQIRTKSELFKEGFLRFVRDDFPSLTPTIREFGRAWQYRLTHNDQVVIELETLPVDGSWLEISIAQPHPREYEYQNFAPQFIRWVQKRHEVKTELLNHDAMFRNAAGETSVTGFIDAMVYEARKDMKFDDPEKDAGRQAYLDYAEEGIPPVPNVPNEQGTSQGQRAQLVQGVLQEPGPDATLDDWCRYKYECGRSRKTKFTHEMLGDKVGMTEGSVRNYYNDKWKPLHRTTDDET